MTTELQKMIQSAPPVRNAGQAVGMSREVAQVQAAMIMAQNFPRHQGVALQRIQDLCENPRFADTAMYEYSKGGTKISGLSIRAAEALAQCWGNIDYGFRVVEVTTDDRGRPASRVKAFCWDLETNVTASRESIVPHWVDTKQGGRPANDEREVYELVANMAQRRVRAMILEVIPRHISDAAEEAIIKTQDNIGDIEKARSEIGKALQAHGVQEIQVEKFIQKKWSASTRNDLSKLKRIAVSLRDGMGKVEDWFEPLPDAEKLKRTTAAAPAGDTAALSPDAKAKLDDARAEFDVAVEDAISRGVDIDKEIGGTVNIKSWSAKQFTAATEVLKKAGIK